MVDFYDDIPDDVLDEDDAVFDPREVIEEVRSEDNFEVVDVPQDIMLGYLTQNPDIWVKSMPLLREGYFEREYRSVIRFVKEYYREHGRLPPSSIILAQTGVRISNVEDSDRSDVVEHMLGFIEGFCQHGATEEVIRFGVDLLGDRPKLLRSEAMLLREKFEEASRVSMKRDLGINIHNDVTEYLERDRDYGSIPTGIGFLDKAFGGGVTQPSLNVVSAASGQGKSIFLQNMAFNYAIQGKNVIFYTLELEYPTIVKRFAAMMTNTDIALVTSDIYSISHQMRMMGKQQGAIMCMKFPMNSTMIDIEAHFRDLSLDSGFLFQVVCIDYIDVMGAADKSIERSNIHIKDKDISEDMNNFLHANNLIGWTASQQTKTAVEEKELKSSNVSGGRSKVDTADNLIMLRRNDEERDEGRTWALIKKARSSGGVGSKVPLFWNPQTQRMGDGDHDLFVKENPHIFGEKSKQMREQDNKLNEKLAKDAVAKELGVPEKRQAKTESKKANEARSTRKDLANKLSKGKKDDEEET